MNSIFKFQGFITVVISLVFISCSTEKKSSESVQTTPLSKADSNLLIAQQKFATDSSEENCIWVGRRLSYLNRYDEAIAVYTNAIVRFPESYKLYRHRGHRYISMRKFDLAINDLEKAVSLMKDLPLEVEPDGIPNRLNKPLSNGHFNVWYHLGLAYYLTGDFEKAINAYQECMKVSNNDDLRVATSDWLYMTYRRANKPKEAASVLAGVNEDMLVIENDSYYKRIKMYKGLIHPNTLLQANPESPDYDLSLATQGYGVANYYYVNNEQTKAKEILEKIVQGKSTNSFGYIAAETDLKRLKF